jgi:hypothetical protein
MGRIFVDSERSTRGAVNPRCPARRPWFRERNGPLERPGGDGDQTGYTASAFPPGPGAGGCMYVTRFQRRRRQLPNGLLRERPCGYLQWTRPRIRCERLKGSIVQRSVPKNSRLDVVKGGPSWKRGLHNKRDNLVRTDLCTILGEVNESVSLGGESGQKRILEWA